MIFSEDSYSSVDLIDGCVESFYKISLPPNSPENIAVYLMVCPPLAGTCNYKILFLH